MTQKQDEKDFEESWDNNFPYNKYFAEMSIMEYAQWGFFEGRRTLREKPMEGQGGEDGRYCGGDNIMLDRDRIKKSH